ncbi:VCBS repeat-containing protein [bacterium]|nr:VCBS repeat-containing protein [bacterium]
MGAFPLGVALADFNGDGELDFAATNGSASSVSVAFGNNNGTFAAAVNYPANFNPVGVEAADFNGDGNLDIVVVNDGNDSVSVLLNSGDGTFGSATAFGTNGIAPRSVAVGDFNGDGKVDIAATNASNSTNFISVFTNTTPTNGVTASFTRTTIPTGGNGQGVSVGDLNGDMRPDIVNVDFQNNTVSVRLNTTATPGSSPTFGSRVTYGTGSVPQLSTLGDFNDDGKLDVAITFSGGVDVLLGQGDGTFGSATSFAVAGGPTWIEVGDFDGDGKLDLVVAGGDGIHVLLGEGDGTFGAPTNYGANGNNTSVAVGNINGDVRPDLVTNNFIANTVSVLLNTGALSTTTAGSATAAFGSADQPVTLTVTVVGTGGEAVNGGTFTFTVRDALNNVVGTPAVSGTVANGTASATYTLPGGTPAGAYTIETVYTPGSGNLTTSTDAAGILTVAPADAPAPIRLTAEDTAVGGGPRVTVRSADGSVRFDFFAFDPAFRGGVTAAVADLNGDGVDDIVTGAGIGGAPHVKVFDGRTGAEVASFFAYDASFQGGVSVGAADENGDGTPDIVTGAGPGGSPHVKAFRFDG